MNVHNFNRGAINTATGLFESPLIAKKSNSYKCPQCNRNVFPKQGKVLKWHFAHKPSSEPCDFYDRTGESEEHKYAKMLVENHFNNYKQLHIKREYACCKKRSHTVLQRTASRVIKQEHSFYYNTKRRSADIAILENETTIVAILEIYQTHKTAEADRPEPWFELKALDVIGWIHTHDSIQELECMRTNDCMDCGEAKRIAAENRKKAEILAWEKKLREQQIKDEKNKEAQLIAEDARRKAELIAEEERQQAEQKENAEREEAQQKAEIKRKEDEEENAVQYQYMCKRKRENEILQSTKKRRTEDEKSTLEPMTCDGCGDTFIKSAFRSFKCCDKNGSLCFNSEKRRLKYSNPAK